MAVSSRAPEAAGEREGGVTCRQQLHLVGSDQHTWILDAAVRREVVRCTQCQCYANRSEDDVVGEIKQWRMWLIVVILLHGRVGEVKEPRDEPCEVEQSTDPVPPCVPPDEHFCMGGDVDKEAEEEEAVEAEGNVKEECMGRESVAALIPLHPLMYQTSKTRGGRKILLSPFLS